MHLKEILTAFTIDLLMMAGIALPLVVISPRLKKSPQGWIRTWILGMVFGILMVALAIWYLGTRGPAGTEGFRSAAFRWGMGGFGIIGGVGAFLLGTFATDAARTASEAKKSFLAVSIPVLLLFLALGIPFAYLQTWPESGRARLLIAPVTLIAMLVAMSPLIRAAAWIASRLGKRATDEKSP